MGADAIAKRYFPAIVCALLALVAFFQARGVGALIAGQMPAAPQAAGPMRHGPASSRMTATKSVSAKPILARNAFDSVTGPLDAPPPPPVPVTPGPAEPEGEQEDPTCPSGQIVLIAENADPSWSFAMIRTSSGAKMRRIGDDVDGQTVKAISWDRVWLASNGGRCQIKLDITANKVATGGPPTPGVPKPTTLTPDASPTPSSDEVKKVGENEYVVSRAAVEKASGFANELRKGTNLVPGKGVRLRRVEPSSLLGQVGITSGDIVQTINGFDMTDLDKASEGYSRLKTSKEVSLGLLRNGSPVTISVRIQ